MIKSFLSKYLLKGLFVILVGLAAITYYLYQDNKSLNASLQGYELALNKSVKISNENEKALNDYKQKKDMIIKSLAASHKKQLARARKFYIKKGEIKNVKKIDDAPNANVLNNTLDWLHQQTIAANKDSKSKVRNPP